MAIFITSPRKTTRRCPLCPTILAGRVRAELEAKDRVGLRVKVRGLGTLVVATMPIPMPISVHYTKP